MTKIVLIFATLLTSCSSHSMYNRSASGYMHAGQGYIDSVDAAIAQGEGKSYEEMKDFVSDGDYIGYQVIELDDGTIIILDDDVYVVEA